MSKAAFDAIKAGLTDAVAYAKGDKSRGRAHRVELPGVDVGAVRTKLGMTQAEFARTFRVSVATVQNWEQHRRKPEGPALVLLNVILREPRIVVRALESISR
jgi:putative transcriptional regulator